MYAYGRAHFIACHIKLYTASPRFPTPTDFAWPPPLARVGTVSGLRTRGRRSLLALCGRRPGAPPGRWVAWRHSRDIQFTGVGKYARGEVGGTLGAWRSQVASHALGPKSLRVALLIPLRSKLWAKKRAKKSSACYVHTCITPDIHDHGSDAKVWLSIFSHTFAANMCSAVTGTDR